MMLTNCKNCGAPLILGDGVARCEYCGSEFTDELNVMLTEKRTKLYEAQLVAAQEAQLSQVLDGKNQVNEQNGKCKKHAINTKANNSYIPLLIGQIKKFGSTYELIKFHIAN